MLRASRRISSGARRRAKIEYVILFAHRFRESIRTPAGRLGAMGKGRMRVLVVEDDPHHLIALGDGLAGLGVEVALSGSGREAIELASTFDPDAALVDVMLPDISGITLANVLRGLAGREIRIVAFTGADPEKIRSAMERCLFDDYVAKPSTLLNIALALGC